MGEANRISNNALVVVVGLVISVAWIITGLVRGLAAVADPWITAFVYIVTLVALILIPICARENKWGFLLAMVWGIVIIIVRVIITVRLITGPMPEPQAFEMLVIGGTIWLIIQIPIIVFSYRAYRKS
ncbi:MAG: hypothetical protein ACE5OY_07555 [Candidatus Bathyarchaeia archaeon]